MIARTAVHAIIPALLLAVAVAACSTGASGTQPAEGAEEPAHVEDIAGSDVRLVTLTPQAATRLGIATAVAEAGIRGRILVPYASILYEPDGSSWVYVEQEPLHFVRHPVTIEIIEGDLATLTDGPAPGTVVVRTGVAELYGTEFEVGH